MVYIKRYNRLMLRSLFGGWFNRWQHCAEGSWFTSRGCKEM